MIEREAKTNLVVGLFVLVSLVGLALGILSLSAESGLFQAQYRLRGSFENVLGLLPGAPVWLGGKPVGQVERIVFQSTGAERPVLVVMRINADVQDRIRADSRASIGTIGLLGDAYVEISFGTPGAPVLLDGDEIETDEPVNVGALMAQGRNALANISALSNSLNEVVTTFSENRGAERAVDAIEAVSDIMIETREGSGLIHSLIFDPYDGRLADDLSNSLAQLDSILGEIRTGNGLLHELIYAPTDEQTVFRDIQLAVNELSAAGASLQRLLAGLEQGEGTLGLLLKDPSLYDDLKRLIGGAERSNLVRALIRMAVEQGADPPE